MKAKTKAKTRVKPQQVTKDILGLYYQEVVTKLNKMRNWKRKPSVKQIINVYSQVTEKYAIMIETQLDKIETIKYTVDLPKGWKDISKKKKSKA